MSTKIYTGFKLTDNIKEKLDKYNQDRIIYLYNTFKDVCEDYYGDYHEPFSLDSLKRLDKFLSNNIVFPENEPSVFISCRGFLIIEYDKNDGSAVILEFNPDKLEYYIEDIDEEDEIGYDECEKIIGKI